MFRYRLAMGLILAATLSGLTLLGCLHHGRTASGSADAAALGSARSETEVDDAASPADASDADYAADAHSSKPLITPVGLPKSREPNPLDAKRSFEYLKQICDLGPRMSGSPGMANQQKLLAAHFEKLGGKVVWQRFSIHHPRSGQPVEIVNMLVQWHPERKDRVLLATHYDTRPLPDNETDARKRAFGKFIGANDGGSGTALFMELAHFINDLPGPVGVDLLLLDAEELVYAPTDRYFIGSEYFARDYATNPPPYRYRSGVLLDMIGDKKLQIYQEKNSTRWEDTRPVVDEIWGTARRLGVTEFIARTKFEVNDDHEMLRNVGKIPTCDLIDFDYPVGPGGHFWHTEADTPDKCSGESMAKVGWVVLTWLKSMH